VLYRGIEPSLAGGIPLRFPKRSLKANGGRWWLAALLVLVPALAWCAPRPMLVTVVNRHLTPPQPVAGVRVTLSYFDGSQKITDARERTNHAGQTQLTVWPVTLEQGELRIEVEDAPGLVILQPGEGLLKAIPASLEVALVPKGSPALLDPPQIEAMLDRLSRLSVRNEQLSAALTKARNQPPDFDVALRDWATMNGFAYNDVDQKVRAWAEEALAQREQLSLEQQAEAELGLRHYPQAAALFQGAASLSKIALDKGEEEYIAKRHKDLSSYVGQSGKAVEALRYARQFHRATEVAEEASKKATAEHEHYPEDATFRRIWLRSAVWTEETRLREAMEAAPQESQRLFYVVVDHLQKLVPLMDQSAEAELWVRTQFCFGSIYAYLADLTDEQKGQEWMTRAVTAARSAVDASSREKDPKLWARAEYRLGVILALQGLRTIVSHGPKTSVTLAEPIAAFRASLQVFTREQDPVNWARTQSVLGDALTGSAVQTNGDANGALVEQDAAVRRAVLEVFTKQQYPDDWAGATSSLGLDLIGLAFYKPGNESAREFEEGSKDLEDVREYELKQKNLNVWLSTTDTLCNAYEVYSVRVSSEQAAKLLDRTVEMCRSVFEVLTKSENPQGWAEAKVNLGMALATAAQHIGGDKGIALLKEAVDAHHAALEVYTKSAQPHNWAKTQAALGGALIDLAKRSDSNQAGKLFTEAVSAYQSALSVLSRSESPSRWGRAQLNMADALDTLSQTAAEDKAAADLEQALTASQAALEVYTKEKSPDQWAEAEIKLGRIYCRQALSAKAGEANDLMANAAAAWDAVLAANPKNAEAASTLSGIYHDHLIDFPKAYEFAKRAVQMSPTLDHKLEFAEASLTNSRFDECLTALNSVAESEVHESYVPAYQTLLFACQAGAANILAGHTSLTFSGYSSGIKKSGWSTAGDRKYLAEAPEFASGRKYWVTLFQALEDGDGPSLAGAARALSAILGH
jgi:hypothetical protein